jgi:hypothetical protein
MLVRIALILARKMLRQGRIAPILVGKTPILVGKAPILARKAPILVRKTVRQVRKMVGQVSRSAGQGSVRAALIALALEFPGIYPIRPGKNALFYGIFRM